MVQMTVKMLAKLVLAGAVVAVPTGIAFAQSPIMPKMSLQGDEKHLTPEELERKRQIDDAYKAATAKIPDKTVNDPWADVRPSPPAPALKKTQKPQSTQQ
jgi:hypothetical protein